MKIGLLHYSMPPTVGGVEHIIAAHHELLIHHGHEVVWFCDEKNPPSSLCRTVPGFVPDSNNDAQVGQIVRFLAAQSLDLLIVHNVFTMPFCLSATRACHVLAASNLPVISWVHDIAATNSRYLVPTDSILRRHPAGAQVVAISPERSASYEAVTGFSQVQVVPNGIHAFGGMRGPLPQSHPHLGEVLTGAFPILFHPTRILRRKNIEQGIRVVAGLKKNQLAPRLIITGAPEPFSGDQQIYRAELDALSAALNVANEVHFLGDNAPLATADVGQLYSIADALFFPSEHEGFGIPMLEATLAGLPIFASDTQPLATLADEHGFSFPLEVEPGRLAVNIADFLASDAATQRRKTVREHFDWQEIYRRDIHPLLRSVLP